MNNLLVVYNTFGAKDNYGHYFTCIDSILSNGLPEGTKVAISSVCNSENTRNALLERYKDKIIFCSMEDRVPVNITFNKAVQECVSKFGEFKYYLYVDSGIDFLGNDGAIVKAVNAMEDNDLGLLSFQVINDHCLGNVGLTSFLEDGVHLVPLGSACNGHSELFSNEIYKTFGSKLIPDVFAAYCTESVYSFIVAAINKRWGILGGPILNHCKAVDGASSSNKHISQVFGNHWNNLLCSRDARTFILDPEALEAGLGYEECNKIMLHKADVYENSFPKNAEKLKEMINKYFYLSNSDMDYSKIICQIN